jgi:Asp/Glu/hydantoin racemase
LAGDYPRRVDDGASFADDLSEAARHYKDGFDQSDDPLVRGIRDGLGGIVDGVGRAATTAADSLGRKINEWRQKPDE